jgi:PKD repeat protein
MKISGTNNNSMQRLIIGFCLVFFSYGSLYSQCAFSPCFSEECGSLNVGFRPIGGPSFCEGELIRMENSSQQGFDFFVVDWQDGQVDTMFNYSSFQHIYQIPDSLLCVSPSVLPFSVCFKGQKDCQNGTSCQSGRYDFGIRKRPKAQFTSPAQVCRGTAVTFQNTSCNAASSSWLFHDGTVSNANNPTFTYVNPGTYNVRLIATNACGSDTLVRSVQVVDFPSANFTYMIDSAFSAPCAPVQINFNNQANQWTSTIWSITPNDTTKWMFTDTLMNIGTRNIRVLFKQPGEYIVRLTGTNACSTVVETKTIRIFEEPNFVIDPPGVFCFNARVSSADLNFSYSGNVDSIRWNFVNGSIPTHLGFSFPSVFFEMSGSISFTLYGPCGNRTMTIPINIFEGTITLNQGKTVFCRKDSTYMFTAGPQGGIWSGPGILNPQTGEFSPNNLMEGFHTIKYTVVASGCSFADSIVIQVIWEPTIKMIQPEPFCFEATVTPIDLQFSYQGNIGEFQWTFINGSISAFTGPDFPGVSFLQSGRIILEATGLCGDTLIEINIDIVSDSIVFGSNPESLCSNHLPIQLNAMPSGGKWSGPGIIDADNGIFDPTKISGGGTFYTSYVFEISACQLIDSIPILIISADTAELETPNMCIDEAPITLVASKPGGQWFGQGITIPDFGIFDPMLSGAGIFMISYVFTDINNCIVTISDSIRVDEPPSLIFDNNVVACIGEKDEDVSRLINLIVSPNVGNSIWSGPGIIDQNGIFNSITGGPLSEGRYTLFVTHIFNKCTIRDSVVIELLAKPVLSINTMDTVVCKETEFFSLIASPPGGLWSGPWIDQVTGVIDLNMANGGRYLYSYKMEEGANCGVEGTAEIEIIDLLNDLNVGPMESICEGEDSFTLSTALPLNGFWSGVGIVDSINGIIDLNALEADSIYFFEYCIEGGLNELCKACKSKSFVKYSNPTISLEFNNPACIGADISAISNITNGTIVSWDFGNGIISNRANPNHLYDTEGNFTIIVLAENTHGCKDTIYEDILIVAPPLAAFEFLVDSGCSPLLLEVSNLSSGYELSYYWVISDDTIRGRTPIDLYLTAVFSDTLYNITLISENICGFDSVSKEIKVIPLPKADFGFDFPSGCSPLKVEFANASYGNSERFFWDLGNGDTTSLQNPGNRTYFALNDTVTEYTIRLIAENMCGVDTLSRIITVTPPDVTAFIELDTSAKCQPAMLNLSSFSSAHAMISWTILFENEFVAGSSDRFPSFSLDKVGIYTIVLTASNCGSDFDTAYFEVLPSPTINFTHDLKICDGQTALFTNLTQGAVSPFWDFGDGNTSNEVSPVHLYDQIGPYNVTLQMINPDNGCPAYLSSPIEIVDNPVANFMLDELSGCQPFLIQPMDISSGPTLLQYEWYFVDSDLVSKAQNPIYIFQNAGVYQIKLIVKDENNCISDTAGLEVEVFLTPDADFNYTVNPDDYVIGEVQFENTTVQGESYLWSFGDGQNSTEFSPFHEYDINGPVYVSLIATHYNFGLATCHDTITKPILPEWITTFYAPNAMAPEYGPGEVQFFVPKGLGIQDLQLTIYSPYGEQVWFSDKIENGSPTEFWDGYYRGNIVPQGAYMWVATIKYVNGVEEIQKGTVTVLR